MLPGAHLVTFFITQPLPSVLPASHSWSNFYCGSTNRIRKNVSEFWVGMKYSIITYGSLSCVPREGLLPASFFQHLSVIGPPHYKKRLAIPSHTSQAQKGKKTSQKDHNKCNLLFVQGLKTCMFTCLSVAWGALSYIFLSPNHCPAFSLPATAGPIPTVEVQTGQEKM